MNNTSNRISVVCESTACLPPQLVDQHAIHIVPIPFVLGKQSFLDGVDITPAEFYDRLVELRHPPNTSPPSPGDYLKVWEEAAQDADTIISVTVDSKVSTMQRSTRVAQDLARERLPNVRIEVVDSLSAGMGQGFVALAAARAAQDGATVEEVIKCAEWVANRMDMLVTLDTLEYLAKTSRIPQVAALVGGLLRIKPIIRISRGDILPLARVRTRRKSIEQLWSMIQAGIPKGSRPHVAIQHARALDEAKQMEKRILSTYDCAELYTTEFTPVMGGYCGPGLLGAAFYIEEERTGENRQRS